MNVNLDLNTILQGIAILLLVGGIKGLFNRLSALDTKLSKLNGTVGKLQTWREEHEKLDGAHQEVTKKNISELWTHVNKLKEA